MPHWCLSDEAETINMTFYIKMFVVVVIHSSWNHEQWNTETFFFNKTSFILSTVIFSLSRPLQKKDFL